MPDPSDYFLAAANKGDELTFLSAASGGNQVQFLVDGSEFFPAVEEAMAAATEAIYLGFWAIYADTPLLSAAVKTRYKVQNWQQLLAKKARDDGVKVRIMTSDFDPALWNDNHQRSWLGFQSFVAQARKSGLTADQFQVFITRHPGMVQASGVPIFGDQVKKEVESTLATLNGLALAGLDKSPGLWTLVQLKGKKLSVLPAAKLVAWVASYHQKTVLVDNQVAFVGGINISDFYQNPPTHAGVKQRAHDAFTRLEGPIVGEVERNFVGRWNNEFPRFTVFVNDANAAKLGSYKIDNPFPISALALSKKTLPTPGKAMAQLHRTVSTGITSLAPDTVRDDVARTYERVISLANDYIYIENQYFRSANVVDWIIKRFKSNKALQVILIVPVLPEELEEGKGDPITNKGVMLEYAAFSSLETNLGRNFGLYSLVQNSNTPRDFPKKTLASYGSLRIYPHSKIIIVDDVFASIGSANVNERGFRLDSEVDLGWYEPESVKALRQRLWGEHLGSKDGSLFSTWKAADYVSKWNEIADKNKVALATRRQGFVVPHVTKKPEVHGVTANLVPDWLASAERGGGPTDPAVA